MSKSIPNLAEIYDESMALLARTKIVEKKWEHNDLPPKVLDFKQRFQSALIHLRSDNCSYEDKYLFLDLVFRSELRILVHQIVEIKRLDLFKAEDVCQDLLINLFKRIIPSDEGKEKTFQLFEDDYKSFVFYCLKMIKNFGSQQYQTEIKYTVKEYS